MRSRCSARARPRRRSPGRAPAISSRSASDVIVLDHGPGAHHRLLESGPPRDRRHARVLQPPALRPLHGLRAAGAAALGSGRGSDSRPRRVRPGADRAHDDAALWRGRRLRRATFARGSSTRAASTCSAERGGTPPRRRPAPRVTRDPRRRRRRRARLEGDGRSRRARAAVPRVPGVPARQRRGIGLLLGRQRPVRRSSSSWRAAATCSST